jgi:hypothetical protein
MTLCVRCEKRPASDLFLCSKCLEELGDEGDDFEED